jgi:hypothetical protein
MQASVLPYVSWHQITRGESAYGGGGARIGMVIGGRPGISIT